MFMLYVLGLILVAYALGSIPSGLVIVWLFTGKDIRKVESGRTGGTNAMRAAGYPAGIATAALDILKAAAGVWLARWILPGNPWIEVIVALAAILGHNYSIYLIERNEQGQLHLRGGAGGAPTVGGALGLWPPSILIIIPVGVVVFFGLGYASVTTMSLALSALVIFAVRAWMGISPWQYVLYGLLAEALLLYALRPNIRRLLNGTERGVSWRARRQKQVQEETFPHDPPHSSSSSS